MSISRVAYHLRTGSVAAGNLIRAWLEAHSFTVQNAADAYSAVAFFHTAVGFEPDLVLIGATGLAPGEERVVQYAAHRWPSSWIVVYDDMGEFERPRLACVRFVGSTSSAAFREMIARSPMEYVAAAERAERSPDGPADPECDPLGTAPAPA